jgi:hypothetical protein
MGLAADASPGCRKPGFFARQHVGADHDEQQGGERDPERECPAADGRLRDEIHEERGDQRRFCREEWNAEHDDGDEGQPQPCNGVGAFGKDLHRARTRDGAGGAKAAPTSVVDLMAANPISVCFSDSSCIDCFDGTTGSFAGLRRAGDLPVIEERVVFVDVVVKEEQDRTA